MVLLAILWIIFFIFMVVVLYVELGWKKIQERGLVYSSDELRATAYSAPEISLAVINEHNEE